MSQSQETITTTPGGTLAVRAPRMWVGSVLLLAGLGLIVLGGCFLIGIWIMIGAHGVSDRNQPLWSPEANLLMLALYGVTGVCLFGSVALIVLGVRTLLGLLKG